MKRLEILFAEGNEPGRLASGPLAGGAGLSDNPLIAEGEPAGREAQLSAVLQALEENERFLQHVFDGIRDGISVLDRELNIVRVNRWMQERHADHRPLTGKKCYAVYQHRESVCPWCPSVRTIETGEPCSAIVPHTSDKGHAGWTELSSFPFKDTDGQVIGVIEHVRDITERVQMEQALQESEEQLRTLIDATPDAVCFKDGAGRWLEANVAILQLFELEGVDYRGKTDAELAEYSEFYRDAFLTCKETDEATWRKQSPARDDEVIPRPDGTTKVYDVIKVPLFYPDGRRKGLVVLGRDITERRRAEEALRRAKAELERQNARLQALYRVGKWINSTLEPEAILDRLVDEAMRVTQASHGQVLAAQEEVGEFERRSLRGFSPAEAELARNTPLSLDEGLNGRAYASRQVVCVDDVQAEPGCRRLIPTTRAALAVPIIRDGQVLGNLHLQSPEVGAFRDVDIEYLSALTDQVAIALANAQLFRTVELAKRDWESTFDAMQDAIALVDRDYRIVRVNRTFADMVQKTFREVLGQKYHTVLAGARCSEPACPLEGALARGQAAACVHEYDGRVFEIQTTPVPEGPNRAAWAIYVMRDITEQMRLEEQFRQAQKMEAVGRLAGGVAHDFNNLLTVIRISSQLLERQLHPEDPLWSHVQRIRETGERAINLVKQLLSFSRREIIKPQSLDLNQVVSDLTRMLRRLIGEDVELRTRLAEGLWPVHIDPTQVDQIIINLAVNARDAMPEGGALTIETANVRLDQAYAAHHLDAQPGEYVMLTISDTGVGMDDEAKSHLFEPFFTTKEPGQGTGLGLATVYGIVKQNGGHIWVYSTVGVGTTFKIYLPRFEIPALASDAYRPQAEIELYGPAVERQGAETILLAEDEADVRTLAAHILRAYGYHVLTARDGVEALQIGEQHHGAIHLLLTDVVMPRMDGKELAARLRDRRPDMRVLYMSGYTDNVIAHRGVLAEGVAFLAKPFNLDSLTQKVRAVLDAPIWLQAGP